ncbi:MAG: carbon-nitrogen hydrolase family protein [Planctomycetes bacterium]|nr:carbon-nitrogen hydrolase family protein [Planctomycetota bacterium]
MKIALIQQHAAADIEKNIERAIAAYQIAAQQGAQLIAYAELAFTPFYPQKPATGNNLELSETIPGPLTERFAALAKKHNIVTVLNLFEKDGDLTYDSSPVIDADGTLLGVTRMVHILEAPCFHEQSYYTPGDGKSIVFDTAVGKVGVVICYDRHYPEYMRALGLQGAELVIIPQAGSVGEWPEGVYEAELQIASFQNGYFTALCNRVGAEEYLTFEGKSFVTAPDGRILAQAPADNDAICYADIDLDEVKNSHARQHFLADRRPELYRDWLTR